MTCRPDAPLPEEPGPFGVGVRSVTVDGPTGSGRRLTLEVWYPVARTAITAGAVLATYDFLPTVRPPARLAFAGDLAPASGAFPVVVYSHGRGGMRFIASFFTEVLASHGFVVVAADHAGDTAVDAFLGSAVSEARNLELRPGDASTVIDAVLASRGELAWLAGHVDAARVGIVGHSFGATTALALAGGTEHHGPDLRVRAVVGMAAYTRPLTDQTLRAVGVPALLISGTADASTPIPLDTERPWRLVAGRPFYRVDLDGAGHQSFTDVCAYRDLLDSVPDLPEALRDAVHAYAADGCGPGLLDIGTALRWANRYAVAFLLRWVAGDIDAARWLTQAQGSEADRVVAVQVRREQPRGRAPA